MFQNSIACYPANCCDSMKTTIDAVIATAPAGCTAKCGTASGGGSGNSAASFTTHMLGVVSETIFTVVSAVPASTTPSRAGDPMTPAEFANVVKNAFTDGKMKVCLLLKR